jgi:hypothetical protein
VAFQIDGSQSEYIVVAVIVTHLFEVSCCAMAATRNVLITQRKRFTPMATETFVPNIWKNGAINIGYPAL